MKLSFEDLLHILTSVNRRGHRFTVLVSKRQANAIHNLFMEYYGDFEGFHIKKEKGKEKRIYSQDPLWREYALLSPPGTYLRVAYKK